MKKFLLALISLLFVSEVSFALTGCPAGQTRHWLLIHTGSTIDLTNDSGHVIGKTDDSGFSTTIAGHANNTCAYVQDGFGGWDTNTVNPDYNGIVKYQQYMFIDGSNAKGTRIPAKVGILGDRLNPGKRVKQLQNVDSGSDADRTCTFMSDTFFRVAVCQD